jgi:biopolymer transport protein ExbD
MSLRRRRAPAKALPSLRGEINVTPLVDVVLVLLILFMVVTPLLSRGVKVELPESAFPERRQDGDQILVGLNAEGGLFLDGQRVGDDGFDAAVRSALARRRPAGSTREVHVQADRRLRYGDVRRLLDRLHRDGAPRVALGVAARPR